jgi:hypothetical protein
MLRHKWEGCTNADNRRQETRRARAFHGHNERKRTHARKESRYAHETCEDAKEAHRSYAVQERADARKDQKDALITQPVSRAFDLLLPVKLDHLSALDARANKAE